MTGDRRVLDRLLGPPELGWLRERVRARVLAAGSAPLAGVVRLDDPTSAQREAVTRLVGPSRRAGASLRVDLGDVEAVLRRGPWPAGLVDAVVTLTGPVHDMAAERRDARDAWDRAAGGLAGAEVGPWWDAWCAAGGLKRAARSEAARLGVEPGPAVAARMVGDVARLLTELPAAGVPIAVFARQTLGDAHALDHHRPLGRLAVAVVGATFGVPDVSRSRRDVWAGAGVVLSHVASTVLSLGVPGSADDAAPLGRATSTALEAMRAARSPLVLTLDQVRSGGVAPLPGDRQVHVCENPTVVEVVADRWARDTAELVPVLVCTSGQPSTAVLELLDVLTAEGAHCRYHGDFDWAGLQIAEVVRRRVPWTPWRYSTADYLAVAAGDAPVLLRGRPVEAVWDPALATAMAAAGRAVEEEAVVDDLAGDLVPG